MERIAFILGGYTLYYSAIILTLAAAGAMFLFLALYLSKGEHYMAAFVTVPLAALLSLLAARLVHWYCYPQRYESLLTAILDLSNGGFALVGVFAGCLLAALITRLLQLHDDLPEMLDCMCLAGGAGIAAGRLASFFSSSDRGQILETIHTMPLAYPVTNSVSGATEYRLATFLLQAMVVGIITIVLLLYYTTDKDKPLRSGDTALLFLLCYGASQVVLDSTRYDSIYFRSNGFVSIVQVFSALALALVIVIFSVRLVKRHGFHIWYLGLWGLLAALVGCAGYMEYHVQRHGNEALFAYSVMSGSLLILVIITIVLRLLAQREPRVGAFEEAWDEDEEDDEEDYLDI